MARDRSNRIEVDLKLLQDKNLQSLQRFGEQFDKSIIKLAETLSGFSDRGYEPTRAVENPGRLSPNASTDSGIDPTGPQARLGGIGIPGFGAFVNPPPPGGGYYGGGDSTAGSGNGRGKGGTSQDESFERQFIRAQKRIGEIPIGFRQTLGYVAEGQEIFNLGAFRPSRIFGPARVDEGEVDENGEPLRRFRLGATRANDLLFRAQALRANAMRAGEVVRGVFSGINTQTALGLQLGRSREGFLGTGLLSSAFTTGVKENLKVLRDSAFGFNPSYSKEQARTAREAIHQFGYSGDTGDYLATHLKELEIHQGIDPATAMAFLDPLMRFGGTEDFGQLLATLKDLPNAAKAAHMGLDALKESLTSTAQQVASATGMTPGGAGRALMAFTETTGLDPSRGADLLSDPDNLLLAASFTGQSITSLMEGDDRMAGRLAFPLEMFKSFTGGYSAQQLARMRKKEPKRYEAIMNQAYYAYIADPSLFGGFNPRELINMGVRNKGRVREHMSIREQMGNAGSITKMETLLKRWGGKDGHHMVDDFEEYLTNNPDVTVDQARTQALDLIAKSQRTSQRQASAEMTAQITMTDETKRWFKLLQHQEDNTHDRNNKSFFDRVSSGAGSGFDIAREIYGAYSHIPFVPKLPG